jgi:high-affinity iron transporter
LPEAQRKSPEFTLKVINGLLDTANSEYGAAVANGKIAAVIEYKDSRGFVNYVDTTNNRQVMDFSAALPTFVITLRQGVEAALVVGIVLALLKKARATELNPWVYAGVSSGLIASTLVGVLFGWVTQRLSASYPQYASLIEPIMEGVFSVIAIAMLSWMLIWMTQQARFMKAEVEGAVTAAIKQGDSAG